MKKLYDFDILHTDIFYRSWYILDYIENHPNMTEIDKLAIKATIMDALVFKGLIDPGKQSLNLDFKKEKEYWCIEDSLDFYTYEKHPNISSIPLWMKEEYRKKSIRVSDGLPISLFLARPAGNTHYCVFDPNTAVSSIFEEANFYKANYLSPTRGIRALDRPFVEIKIDGENYLVDTLTKRILKTSWFKENYNLEIISTLNTNHLDVMQTEYYQECLEPLNNLAELIESFLALCIFNDPKNAEFQYELEKTKTYFPEEWERYAILMEDKKRYFQEDNIDFYEILLRKKKEDK